jgi:hypothetical protein
MVDSIDAITESGGISKTFVGLILLPIVGNAAEHATAVTVAVKDKMDLAIGVAVGSSMQIALLVLPFAVVLGWGLGKEDMTLDFDGFQIAVLFVAVLLVNYLIQDGKSHWYDIPLLWNLFRVTDRSSGWKAFCCKHCISSSRSPHGSIPIPPRARKLEQVGSRQRALTSFRCVHSGIWNFAILPFNTESQT